MHTEQLTAMIPPLLAWHGEHRRPLPWREDPTPYHVWISEIMLQQTRIEAVIPYYERFLAAFPDIKALAECDDDRLMKLWEGLGYYSRARNLKKAALVIMKDFGGALPDTAEALETLPGIGAYTAGAIASISFGRPTPAVDGNVLRVITRVLGLFDDIMLASTKKEITRLLAAVYPVGDNAKALTEAIMELGESLCIPNGEPKCALCPLADLCAAHKNDLTDKIPVKTPKKARRIENRTVLLLSHRGSYAIRKRPEAGLLARLWEFPSLEGHLTENDLIAHLASQGITPVSVRPLEKATHIFTHVEWHMIGYAVECTAPAPAFLWKSAEEIRTDHAIPTALRAYSEKME